MKKTIEQIHYEAYVHLSCCHFYLYDVNVRIEFEDYLKILKKYLSHFHFSWGRRIFFFIKRIDYFIFEMDFEIIHEAFDFLNFSYDKLKQFPADEKVLVDYASILNKLEMILCDEASLD